MSDLPLVRNVTREEYVEQIARMLANHESVSWLDPRRPLKVSFGRAGEPLLNRSTVEAMHSIGERWTPAFQVFSVMPDNATARTVNALLLDFAADYGSTVQLVVSMHTTDENKRRAMMPYGGG